MKAIPTTPTSIRFTEDERKAVERAAARDGLKFGPWTKSIAVLAAREGIRVKRTVRIARSSSRAA